MAKRQVVLLEEVSVPVNDARRRRFGMWNLLVACVCTLETVLVMLFLAKVPLISTYGCIPVSIDHTRSFFLATVYSCIPDASVSMAALIIIEGIWASASAWVSAIMSRAYYMMMLTHGQAAELVTHAVSAALLMLVIQSYVGMIQTWMFVQTAFLVAGTVIIPLTIKPNCTGAIISQTFLYMGILVGLVFVTAWSNNKVDVPAVVNASVAMLILSMSVVPIIQTVGERMSWSSERTVFVLSATNLLMKTVVRALIIASLLY